LITAMSDLAALLAGLSPAEQAELRASIASGGAGNGGSFGDLLGYLNGGSGFAPQPGQGGPRSLSPHAYQAQQSQNTTVNVNNQAALPPPPPLGGSGGEPLPEPGSREESWYTLRNALPGMAQGLTRLRPGASLGETLNAGLGGLLQGMGGVKAGLRQERREERQDAQTTLMNAIKMDELKQQQKGRDAAEAHIAGLEQTDPEQAARLRLMLQYDPSKLGDVLFPGAGETKVLAPGAVLVDASGKTIAQGPEQTMTPAQAAQFGLSKANYDLAVAKFKWDQQHPSGDAGEPMVAVQGPEGPIYVPRSQAAGMTPASPRDAGITMFDPATGNPIAQVGGDPQAVKLPTGFYFAEPSEEAKAAGITSRVAAPIPGTPEYAKATGEVEAVRTFRGQLDQLGKLYEKHGTSVLPGEARGELESLQNALKLSFAQAKGQGALQKTDEAVIASVLGAVTSPMSLLPGGNAQVTAQIKSAQALIDQDLDTLRHKYPWQSIKPMGGQPKPKEKFATMPATGGPRAPGGIVSPTNAAPAPTLPPAAAPAADPVGDSKYFGFAP
jgi:hypothetical protein